MKYAFYPCPSHSSGSYLALLEKKTGSTQPVEIGLVVNTKLATGTASGRTRKLKSIIGKLQSAFEYEASYSKRDVPISEKQAHRLKIQPHQSLSLGSLHI